MSSARKFANNIRPDHQYDIETALYRIVTLNYDSLLRLLLNWFYIEAPWGIEQTNWKWQWQGKIKREISISHPVHSLTLWQFTFGFVLTKWRGRVRLRGAGPGCDEGVESCECCQSRGERWVQGCSLCSNAVPPGPMPAGEWRVVQTGVIAAALTNGDIEAPLRGKAKPS